MSDYNKVTLLENIFGYAVWVEYFPEASNHGHVMLVSTPDETISMGSIIMEIEAYADEFAEMFERCDDERHGGKAHKHHHLEIEEARRQVVQQLLSTDYAQAWSDMKAQERAWKRWGGPPPAFTLHPTIEDPSKWEVMVTDREGSPAVYDVRDGAMDDLVEDPRASSVPNKEGIGWTLKEDKDAQ